MKKKAGFALTLCVALLIGGCGTAEDDLGQTTNELVEPKKSEENGLETARGREIIAELEQTVKETPKRDALAKEQIESDEYQKGMFGKPSPELEEDTAVQAIEAMVAIETVEDVYGGHGGFQKEGVLFIENQMSGAEQSGVWIGIKEPDERLDELLALLQSKVDAGEILAEPIYFYRSPHTGVELQELQKEVAEVIKPMWNERGSYGLSVNTITGNIEITHDFLKEEQQEELREKFADYTIHFEQDGRMIAEPGEPTTTYPKEPFTTIPSLEGEYVMDVGGEGMLVVATKPADFGSTGGKEEFYGAANYQYPKADEQLKVGQRVHVEMTGMMMTSYPGQARAKFVEVLPEYKPANAKLSESEVIQKAIEKKKSDGMLIISSIAFDEKKAVWKVGVKQEEEEYELEIKDA